VCNLRLGTDGAERVHEPRIIKDDCHVHALAGQAGARAARQHGCANLAARSQRGFNVSSVAREYYADGELVIIR